MPTREIAFTVHPALGGLDIASDPTVLDPNFLTIADNLEYREGGQRKKRGGTYVYSTGTTSTGTGTFMVSSSAAVRGLIDFWRYGASLTPVQNLVAITGASIFTSTGNGKWTAVSATSSFGANANIQTNITLAGDYAVIADETAAPVAYNQSTLSTPSTGSNWPRFSFSTYHLNRLVFGGLSTAPSQINLTAANNIFDSTGADTTSFTVNVGDGDQVMGISRPYFGSVYIFKGPQFGSVHQLSGATLSGFALAPAIPGAPLLNPKALITTPTDIYWISQYGVHSLETTVKFGNVEQAFLSLPIQKLWRDQLISRTVLAQSHGFWNPLRNIVGWVVRSAGLTGNNWILIYNYALSDPKPGGKKFWSIWKMAGYNVQSLAMILTPAGFDTANQSMPMLYFGSDQGQVLQGDSATLGDAGVAYTMSAKTPTITKFFSASRQAIPETQEKSFAGIVTYFNPQSAGVSANLTVTVDRRAQTGTVDMSGQGDTLG